MGEDNQATSAGQEGAPTVAITLRVNGVARPLAVEPRTLLVDALRVQLGLTGTKAVCNQGACGACTVLVDGRRVTSCIMLAVMADGCEVTTIEGLAGPGGAPHPLQAAFVAHDALQCGFCTPGQIVSALAFVREHPRPTLDDIRLGMSGNLCRCAAYVGIREAIADAAERMAGEESAR